MTENLNSMSARALQIVEQATEKLTFLYFEGASGEKYQETLEVLESLSLVSLDNDTSVAVLDQLATKTTDTDDAGGCGDSRIDSGAVPSDTVELESNFAHLNISPHEPNPTPPDVAPEWSNTGLLMYQK